MEWTSLNDLREKFLSFFESKGHLRLPGFPLVPMNDKSLLLINSGMAPMKKFFTGEEEPPCHRVATCQKCIRTPDLERVGHTARHGTFFEMLGNFSFGDYFKQEAIPWAWEFLTSPAWLGIPKEKLWPSVYEEDEEAFRLWNDVIGVPAEQITRLGKADNFWEHGSGPCGPCSEIYFDRGEKYGCGKPGCRPGCDCDRYMEIWNNVFSQFNNDGAGHYTELVQKNIDTGMGLERLACVMQGVDNMFEVDTNRKILDAVCTVAGKQYGTDAQQDISIRVCTDHIKSAMFMLCDGVIPSNEGRGYVLRRIIRRACRHGKLLGIDHPFLSELLTVSIAQNAGAYPELLEKEHSIRTILTLEEQRFNTTIDAGLSILASLIASAKQAGKTELSGEDAFRLYDTFGFPIDLTREILAEAGFGVDEAGFSALMQEQRVRAREARGKISGWSSEDKQLLGDAAKTDFAGYESLSCEATVLAIVADNLRVNEISEGDCSVILDRSPFYGEGGGQVGDTGVLEGDTVLLTVGDTKKTDGVYIHLCTVSNGILRVGDKVRASVDGERRSKIARNHACVHLLQAALREVLGNHVAQAGSYVDETHFRFDFSHFSPMTSEELGKVEALINRDILGGLAVTCEELPIAEAKKLGAMALFGEKYGEIVRVVRMGDRSVELCGGTHVANTAQIGLAKLTSETSVAAGVRRIEGVTGTGLLALLAEKDRLLADTAAELKAASVADLTKRASALQAELKAAKREAEALSAKLAASQADAILQDARAVGGVRVVTHATEGVPMDVIRSLCDTFKEKDPAIVAVLSVHVGERLNFVAVCGKDAVAKGAHAGNLLKQISAIAGGNGGGRPDSATSGGRDASKVAAALAAVPEAVSGMLK